MLATTASARPMLKSWQLDDTPTQPLRQSILRHFACTQRKPTLEPLPLVHSKIVPVEAQKQSRDHRGNSFVPVEKWVVARNPEGVRASEIRQVRLSIKCQMLRPVKCRFEKTKVADAVDSTVLGYLLSMDSQHDQK
jgi:hypothetical protein